MKVHIDKVTDLKSGDYGLSSKIHQGNESWFVNEDATPLVGKDLEIEETVKTSAKGNKYKTAKIVKQIDGTAASGNSNGNGGISWEAYEQMAGLAHRLALDLEPDAFADHGPEDKLIITVDRSTSRAAILNTVMIAFSNGKIALPGEEDMPF